MHSTLTNLVASEPIIWLGQPGGRGNVTAVHLFVHLHYRLLLSGLCVRDVGFYSMRAAIGFGQSTWPLLPTGGAPSCIWRAGIFNIDLVLR